MLEICSSGSRGEVMLTPHPSSGGRKSPPGPGRTGAGFTDSTGLIPTVPTSLLSESEQVKFSSDERRV